MCERVVVSVDAMGGDHGPPVVAAALARAIPALQGVRFLLHGDGALLESQLGDRPALAGICEVRHTNKALAASDKPHQAIRRGRGTSLWNAVESVRSGEAHACVSAGDTGALMAISKLLLGMVADLERPAIVARWPSRSGLKTVLDLGANIECGASQLVEFAIMGAAFHKALNGAACPKVGLLNIGSEDQKGLAEVREANAVLRAARLDLDYRGFVEGADISFGDIDVVVTDGFTGNIALKTAEGAVRYLAAEIKESLRSGPFAAMGGLLASRALARVAARMDPGNSNGAPLLGLNGIVVKSHGAAEAQSYAAALIVAVNLARKDFVAELGQRLAELSIRPNTMPGPARVG
jgi:glycerol-3-phosphate acyltransferase PlsX